MSIIPAPGQLRQKDSHMFAGSLKQSETLSQKKSTRLTRDNRIEGNIYIGFFSFLQHWGSSPGPQTRWASTITELHPNLTMAFK